MRRHAVRLITLAVPFFVFGCAEHALAPSRGAELATHTPNARVIVDSVAPDSMSADFTVTPSGGVFQLGKHAIYFPSNSICDPSSSYGVTEWDQPCTAAREPIHIHADIGVSGGKAYINFTPALRFVPARSWSKWVVIYMRSGIVNNVDLARQQEILWSPADGQPAIDESVDDPSLRTFYVPSSGLLFRRIKHFSGYQVHDTFADSTGSTL